MAETKAELIKYLLSDAEKDSDFKAQFGDIISRLSLFEEVSRVVATLESRSQNKFGSSDLSLLECLIQLTFLASTRMARLHADQRFRKTGDLKIISEELFGVLDGQVAKDARTFAKGIEDVLRKSGPGYTPYVTTVAPPSLRLVGYDPRIKLSNGKIDQASFAYYYERFCDDQNTILVEQDLSTTYAFGRRSIDQSVNPFGEPADVAIVDLASVPDLAHRNTIFRLNELSTDIQNQLQKDVVDAILNQAPATPTATPAPTKEALAARRELLKQLIDRLCSSDTGLYALPCWINNHVILSEESAASILAASGGVDIYAALLARHKKKVVPVQTRAGSCITYELFAHFASEGFTPIAVVEADRQIRVDIDIENEGCRRAFAGVLHRVLAFQSKKVTWASAVNGSGALDWAIDHEGEARIINAIADSVDFTFPTELLGKIVRDCTLHVPAVAAQSESLKAFTSVGGYGLVIPRSCRDPNLALKKIGEHVRKVASKTLWHVEFGSKRTAGSKAWDDSGLFHASLGYLIDRTAGLSVDHASRLDCLVRPRTPFWRELEQHFTTAIEELAEAWPRGAISETDDSARGALTLDAVNEWLRLDKNDVRKIIERVIRRIRDTASDFGWTPDAGGV